jgi:hypothetical protein
MVEFNLNKSLRDLEGYDAETPTYDSHLVLTCYKLWYTPLKQFNTENLKIMIGQSISLRFLVPLALERLHRHPLAGGDFYEGDLLVALLRSEPDFGVQNPSYFKEVHQIIRKILLMGQKKKKRFWPSIGTVMEVYQCWISSIDLKRGLIQHKKK